ncbi:MAG: metallophosphoesterase [Thermostichus sp. DRC_bins_24]
MPPVQIRFGVVSDPHIALPATIGDPSSRFHLVEVSIPALEQVLQHFSRLDLDFLLLPGDLTQHGEPENHAWLAERLARLPFPVFVVPGNHDVPQLQADGRSIGLADFPRYYQAFGYEDGQALDYSRVLMPGVRLIGLNSNHFDAQGHLVGGLQVEQLTWLEKELAAAPEALVLLMVHHNVVEHLRGQSLHAWGRRYMLDNAPRLRRLLQTYGVQLVFTGHLHMQHIARRGGVYDITTGSLVSFPHPYRLVQIRTHPEEDGLNPDEQGIQVEIESYQVGSLPDWPHLQEFSREWMGQRSEPVMVKFLTSGPFHLPLDQAEALAPQLRYLWAGLAAGDPELHFPHFPQPAGRFLQGLSRSFRCPPDNHANLRLQPRRKLS